jgi:hypothetical protein
MDIWDYLFYEINIPQIKRFEVIFVRRNIRII